MARTTYDRCSVAERNRHRMWTCTPARGHRRPGSERKASRPTSIPARDAQGRSQLRYEKKRETELEAEDAGQPECSGRFPLLAGLKGPGTGLQPNPVRSHYYSDCVLTSEIAASCGRSGSKPLEELRHSENKGTAGTSVACGGLSWPSGPFRERGDRGGGGRPGRQGHAERRRNATRLRLYYMHGAHAVPGTYVPCHG